MIGKLLSYLAGVVTGFVLAVLYISNLFDYIFKFIPLGAWDEKKELGG